MVIMMIVKERGNMNHENNQLKDAVLINHQTLRADVKAMYKITWED